MRWTDLIRRARQGRPAGSSSLGQWIEAVLLVVLIIQIARLLWALGTPVGLFGDWRAREPVLVSADARSALFAGFDPFFRNGASAGGGVQQVTSLPFRLFGIRLNEASGQGSAIIANEAGEQASYAVGDQIAPGIILKAVQFDHVVIERGGVGETLYIDQSGGDAPVVPAPPAEGGPAMPPEMTTGAGPQAPAAALTPDSVMKAVNMAPRNQDGKVTGIVLNAGSDSGALSQVGFRPGDIIVQINGRPVTSMGDIAQLQAALRPGARLSLMVERGASTVPISLNLSERQ
ncbi:general secretion pathway protein C [Sphingobium sp. B11D3B]|uniref:type II secretion system protein N n=1 Tax=Sphingobium sp. B11D3B TaxID=2940575 RepID=UPI002225CEDD|nr:type II secretion system protein N [Sphingobium sp. B11D3B]MCW2387385.1 general secretion pathway protein C [Sphingobium sp. B11D3B]